MKLHVAAVVYKSSTTDAQVSDAKLYWAFNVQAYAGGKFFLEKTKDTLCFFFHFSFPVLFFSWQFLGIIFVEKAFAKPMRIISIDRLWYKIFYLKFLVKVT